MKQLSKKEIKQFFKKAPEREKEIVIILENVEYARNVAGIFRTADAAGVSKVYLAGVSHQPPFGKDLEKASRHKEKVVAWEHTPSAVPIIEKLKNDGYYILAVELTNDSNELCELPEIIKTCDKVCFVFGSEMFGVTKKTLAVCDTGIFIPMYGVGASLNVGTAVGIVLYAF